MTDAYILSYSGDCPLKIRDYDSETFNEILKKYNILYLHDTSNADKDLIENINMEGGDTRVEDAIRFFQELFVPIIYTIVFKEKKDALAFGLLYPSFIKSGSIQFGGSDEE